MKKILLVLVMMLSFGVVGCSDDSKQAASSSMVQSKIDETDKTDETNEEEAEIEEDVTTLGFETEQDLVKALDTLLVEKGYDGVDKISVKESTFPIVDGSEVIDKPSTVYNLTDKLSLVAIKDEGDDKLLGVAINEITKNATGEDGQISAAVTMFVLKSYAGDETASVAEQLNIKNVTEEDYRKVATDNYTFSYTVVPGFIMLEVK